MPIFQAMLIGVPDDPDAVYNAEYGLGLCRGVEEGGVVVTPTPEP